uniref:Uncharacterized protein n=1 Tax=Hyaloperonospora arabidopsidis (strain Emoy2) TaxID=559515 RepID=M4B782_HYAAE
MGTAEPLDALARGNNRRPSDIRTTKTLLRQLQAVAVREDRFNRDGTTVLFSGERRNSFAPRFLRDRLLNMTLYGSSHYR